MAFFSSLEFGYVVLGLFFPALPQLAIDLTDTPTMPDSSRHRSSISLTTAPGTMSRILFAKHVSFEHSVSSLTLCLLTEERKINNKAKVFQHPIDSHRQPTSSCPIIPHFAAGAVRVGRGAASFLATESIGTVLIQTDDTHCWPWPQGTQHFDLCEHCPGPVHPSRGGGKLVSTG